MGHGAINGGQRRSREPKGVSTVLADYVRTVTFDAGPRFVGRVCREDHIPVLIDLLSEVFDDERFRNEAYMRWLYLESPFGPGWVSLTYDGDEVINHLGAAARKLRTTNGYIPFWLVLNVASRERTRRSGHFLHMCIETWAGLDDMGFSGIFGVMNEQSTKALAQFGVTTEAELPVKVLVPGPPLNRGWTHHRVTEALLDSDEFDELVADTNLPPRRGVRSWWDAELLRWRLRCPLNEYTIHSHPDLVAITTKISVRGVPVVILLKALIRKKRRAEVGIHKTWLSPSGIGAICAHHRSPFALYVGMNSDVRVMGALIPQRFLPSPLQLCFRVAPDQIRTEDLRFDTFELLDFDVL